MLKLIVYKLFGWAAIYSGRFYTVDEYRKALDKLHEKYHDIIMDEAACDFFRKTEIYKELHKKEMEKAFLFGVKKP